MVVSHSLESSRSGEDLESDAGAVPAGRFVEPGVESALHLVNVEPTLDMSTVATQGAESDSAEAEIAPVALAFDVLATPPSSRALWAVAVATVTATAALLPLGYLTVGHSVSFVPAMIGIVTVFDLMSVYLLVGDYRDRGDVRLLAMAGGYVWSLVVMIAYALAFPGAIATHPPFALTPSMAPYFYIGWHGGFPLLLALAWVPWPHRWTQPTPPRARTVTILGLIGGVGVLGLTTVTALLHYATRLPPLIVGLDTSRMTTLTAPLVIPVVALSLTVTLLGTRGRTGPERWTAVAVLVCLCDLILTYTSHARFSLGWYAGRTLTMLAAGVVLMAMQKSFRELKTKAERDATVDVLTGLHNRREAYARLPQMVAQARRRGTSLGVVSFDLDWFKTINDRHGHETGDRVLREVGHVLTVNSRVHDLAARMGGEEFLLVLDDADPAGTAVVAERLRHLVSQIRIEGLDQPVTASFGTTVATDRDLADEAAFLSSADRALYEAKAQGRNRVKASGLAGAAGTSSAVTSAGSLPASTAPR